MSGDLVVREGPGGGGDYASALDLKFSDPHAYNSLEHQQHLMKLAAEKGERKSGEMQGRTIVSDIKSGLERLGAWSEISSSFGKLPSSVADAVEAELASALPTDLVTASARSQERLLRVLIRLGDNADAKEKLLDWIDELSDGAAAAIEKAVAR